MLNILGINISTLSRQEVLEKIGQFLEDGQQHYLVTPNPEIILEAHRDEEFFYILNKADLSLPDGAGLKFAAWAMGKNLRRVTGADLVEDVLEMAQKDNLVVAVLNWDRGLSSKQDIENVLKNKYHGLRFTVEDIKRDLVPFEGTKSHVDVDILFCTLGAPYQEKFIYHAINPSPCEGEGGVGLPSVKVAIGVGGAFDFLTGKIKRAPKIMRLSGLEWLWRLFKQPWRARRIYQAVIVFPLKFIKWRFINPFLYRPNVACLLYRKNKNGYEILLAERRDPPDHWQLPQGGTDGQDLMIAGIRELKEEIGTDKFKEVASFKNLWKYKYHKNSVRLGVLSRRSTGYKGQKQSLFIAEFLGEDKDITINFWDHRNWKWVKANNLINKVYPSRRKATRIFLEKFKSLRITN